jgi:Spy/CpxP family protein refolding chaperone
MKKQILTLTMCLALTATSALAKGTSTVTKAPIKPVCSTCAKSTAAATTAPEAKLTPEQMKQKFEEKMAKDREDFYCKLGLSAQQKAKAEALDKKNRESAKPLFEKFHQEKVKLHELKENKANVIAIDEQKLKVKAARKALRAHMMASKKDFEAILTKDQLAKLEAMKPVCPKCHKNKCHCHGEHKGHEHFGPKGHEVAPEAPQGQAPAAPQPANK